MKWFLFYIFIFPFLLTAQNGTMDSLKLALKNAKYDTTRIKILAELSEICEVDEILNYAEPCINIAEKRFIKIGKNRKNEIYFKYYANALNNAGFLYKQKGNNSKALMLYYKSLKVREEIKDIFGEAVAYNNIGRIYYNLKDFNKAIEFHEKALSIQEKGFKTIKSDDEKIATSKEMATSINNIAGIYFTQNKVDKAIEYYQKSLIIRKKINDLDGIANSLNNLGFIFRTKKNYRSALEFLKEALKIREKLNDKDGLASTLNNISITLIDQNNINNALKYALKGMGVSNESGFPISIQESANCLKLIYKKQNKFKEALEMYELEIQMRDSINNAETKKASIKKQFQYQYEKKAAADSVKNDEEQKVKNAQLTAQHAQLKQEKTQRVTLYGGLVLVVAFLGFVYNRFRITQKQKIIIEQQKVLVDEAFAHLEEKNKEVMDSIRYAKRIQTALLPNEKYIVRKLNELN